MRRFLVGALALIGGLTVLFVGAILALAFIAAANKPGVAQAVVLELELDGELEEHVPEDSLAGAFGPKPTTVRDVVDALEKAGKDARVKALVVRLGGTPGTPAVVQELRDAVKAFRATGKKAVAYADSFGEGGGATGTYYLASAFDEIYLQPSGDVSLLGISTELMFARGALEKLGVKVNMGKRKEFKSAAETFTEEAPTAANLEATERLLTSLFGQVVRGVAEGRKLSEDAVRAAIDNAPLLGQQALEAKLVDGLLYRDEVYEKVKAGAGEGAQLLYLHKYLERVGRPHEQGPTVALVYGVGPILRGKSRTNPMTGENTFGGDSVAAALRRATDDEEVKAILFRVHSPGGSYVASDTVRREVQRARQKGKPVIVSMSGYAASGGYFVSMDADKIVAQPATLTGSIGVYSGKLVTAGMWEKLGVNFHPVGVGRNATMYSSDEEFTPEQLAKNNAFLDRVYEDFTAKAAAGRKQPLEQLEPHARGRVWTGEDALAHGLVDELGGFPKALALAREAARLPEAVTVELFPRKRGAAEVLATLLGERPGDNSEDEGASTHVESPLAPLFEQTRALHRLGTWLGVVPERREILSAPINEPTW
jgi:protease-4